MNTEHTPEGGNLYFRIRGTRIGERYKVANVLFAVDTPEAKAYARLIAAASDLLEALEMANLEFHFPIVGHSSECICARCDFVRKALAAIAKARGKEGV